MFRHEMVQAKQTPGRKESRHYLAWSTLAFALIFGGVARWTWIGDMEWKTDEQWSYRMSQEVGRSQPWPWVGMPTSLGFPNPGLSAWLFLAIGRMATTPTSMARVIVVLNMIGLVGFGWAVRAILPASQREPWIWGLSLQSVSPYAIRLSRKIWPPSILTPLLLLLFISHQRRQARWGAFMWGLVGVLIGQVHLSGWFVAAGLALGTAIAEWFGRLPRSRAWRWWFLGSVLGLVSAIPWARALTGPTPALRGGTGLTVIDRIPGYLYGLVAAPSSAFPFQFMGLGYDTEDFLVRPIIDHVPMHVNEIMCALIVLVFAVRIVMRLWGAVLSPGFRWAWRAIRRPSVTHRDANVSASSEPGLADPAWASTGFYLWCTIAIPSIIFVVVTDQYFYHYYFVMCPFLFVLAAAVVLPWRRLLLSVVIAQALLSFAYLNYIHDKGGIDLGEYGFTYTRQGNR